MTTRRNHLLLFISIAVLSFFAATTIANKYPDGHDQENSGNSTVLHIINALPMSYALQISCLSRTKGPEPKKLGYGKSYNLRVEDKVFYGCYAVWENRFQIWHAYQPRRDENHQQVFWMVKEDGLYHSWDNSTWVKKAMWETE